MITTLDIYRERRDAFLARISSDLAMDEQFAAGWLTGSHAREDADALSDIDISLVVTEPYSDVLCRRLAGPMSQTTAERFSLFSRFGSPALFHENNHNAPEGGTFTFVLYSRSALMVDWTLIPRSKAERPFQAKLLFDKVDIPVAAPPGPDALDRSKKAVAETWAFFWMMAAITIKYIHRGDGVFAAHWIESLQGMIREIERHLQGKPLQYARGSLTSLYPGREEQLQSVKELCGQMLELKDRVSEFTGSAPLTPTAEMQQLFALVQRQSPI